MSPSREKKKKVVISTLADLQDVLNTIPNNVLKQLVCGKDEDGVVRIGTLSTSEDADRFFAKSYRSHPELVAIGRYIKNISIKTTEKYVEEKRIINSKEIRQ